ncbi:hypothetical protein EJ05DRAFT_69986 [Pseudovirgaria hyperparasitica]|uniref:Uncharacterized protein n=1 Tax=Pseudovirgaria hyperparasitica TaxID=470096 RepID=A0A6A6W118_9PEZI|nr:uncharacterized protein EJ05DRAFT_69986 [Pseudovirgaria hyperparasitica]KAF2756608.1 hypothetical protein EJ05DRAFT_69986 [Pseudovirgaria hyperparasitica]
MVQRTVEAAPPAYLQATVWVCRPRFGPVDSRCHRRRQLHLRHHRHHCHLLIITTLTTPCTPFSVSCSSPQLLGPWLDALILNCALLLTSTPPLRSPVLLVRQGSSKRPRQTEQSKT